MSPISSLRKSGRPAHRDPTVVLAIGISALALHPVRAQGSAGDLLRVPEEDREYHRWLADALNQRPEGWQTIWRRSHAMGESLGPFLVRELFTEKGREPRLVITGACSLASRAGRVAILDKRIQGRSNRDRLMALFCIALGPRIQESGGTVLRWIEKSQSDLEKVAGYMALARFSAETSVPANFTERIKDPGVLAARLYSRPDVTNVWLRAKTRRKFDVAYEDLVWRAFLLGRSCDSRADNSRHEAALEILTGGRQGSGASLEAAYRVARSKESLSVSDVDALAGLPAPLLLLLSDSPRLRQRILEDASAIPRSTEEQIVQRRWVTLYTRYAPLPRLERAVPGFQKLPALLDPKLRDPGLKAALGLSLAWRLFSMSVTDARKTGFDTDWLDGSPGGEWLRIAKGQETTGAPRSDGDPVLERGLRLAREGRLPRHACAALLEDALWRSGAHPGHAGLDLHRQLLGELLIDASPAAGTRFRDPLRKPFTAQGLDRGDRFFRVAHEFFKFTRREEPAVFAEHRLRD